MLKVNNSLDDHNLDHIITFSGKYPRMKINFKDHDNATANQIKTLFMQVMAENGVLIINSNNVSFAIKEPEIKRIAEAYDATFADIADLLEAGPDAIKQVIGQEAYAFDPLRKS